MPEWLEPILTSKWTWGILALVVGYLLALVGVLEDAIEVAGHRAGLFVVERDPRQKCGSFDILAADP